MEKRRLGWTDAFVILFLAGFTAATGGAVVPGLLRSARSRHWTPTAAVRGAAKFQEVRMKESPTRYGYTRPVTRFVYADYRYSYSVDGRAYDGRWSGGLFAAAERSALDAVPEGGTFTVYYDPADPAISDPLSGPGWAEASGIDIAMILLFPVCVFGLAFAVRFLATS